MFSTAQPNIACSGRRWRGPGAGRDRGASWRTGARPDLWMSPASPLTLAVGHSGNAPPTPWIGGQRRTRQHAKKPTSV